MTIDLDIAVAYCNHDGGDPGCLAEADKRKQSASGKASVPAQRGHVKIIEAGDRGAVLHRELERDNEVLCWLAVLLDDPNEV